MAELTHFDARGAARMVDVSEKPATRRRAVARGWIAMAPATLQLAIGGAPPRATCSGWRGSPGSWRPSAPPT